MTEEETGQVELRKDSEGSRAAQSTQRSRASDTDAGPPESRLKLSTVDTGTSESHRGQGRARARNGAARERPTLGRRLRVGRASRPGPCRSTDESEANRDRLAARM